METIKTFLDNMFAALPKTQQMSDLKNNILSNMEDKYNELKAAGKSENEAIGIVISEFGNIDELVNELGVKREAAADNAPVITKKETYAYLDAKKKTGFQVGIGIMLCILAAASTIIMYKLLDDGIIMRAVSGDAKDTMCVIPLIILITIAVSIFIYSGMKFERYKYIENGVNLPADVRSEINEKYNEFNRTYYLSLIIGVGLLILSPVTVFISDINNASEYGTFLLLCIVSAAVFLFIYSGTIHESYSRLLRIGDYSADKVKENKVIGIVASIVWPFAAAAFLVCGFLYHLWDTAWVIFPITGILFGAFCAVYSSVTGKSRQ